jgi:hypothetical protein
MFRNALCLAVTLCAFGFQARPALADGANVARFLVHNRLQVKAKPVTPFDAAFAKLQAYSRDRVTTRAIARPTVLLSQTSKRRITGLYAHNARMTAKRELLFDGKRAYLRLTTSSKALRPATTTKTVRVPLGRLFGWYGKHLLKAQFPGLTPRKVQSSVQRAMR